MVRRPERSGEVRWALRLAWAVALVVSGLVVRAWSSSSTELSAAEQHRAAGDLERAVTHYRRAAAWWFPGNERSGAALDALIDIGVDAASRGDSTLALAAFRSARAAIMSARHLTVPNEDLLRRIDREIATLMARGTVPPLDAAQDESERRSLYLSQLSLRRDVQVGWTWLAIFGLVAFVRGVARFGTRGIDETGRWQRREVHRSFAWTAAGLLAYCVGLALA